METVVTHLQSNEQPFDLLSGTKNFLNTQKDKVKTAVAHAKHDYALVASIGMAYQGDLGGCAKAIWDNYQDAGAFQGNTITGAAVGMFTFGMILLACFMGINLISPYILSGDATADADMEKILDTMKAAFGILGAVMIFIALGILISVISGWGR